MVGHGLRPADGAEEDGVVPADLRLPVLRQHRAVLEVVVAGGEIEDIEADVDLEFRRRSLEHAQPFRHDLLADAVAGDDRNSE